MQTGHRAGWASLAAWLGVVVLLPARGNAEDPSAVVVQEIHSSLPLYSFDWDEMWPRHFSSEGELGCASRIAFGDWRFDPTEANEYEEEGWERFSNYGVIHCAAVMRSAEDRAGLEAAPWEFGFFVRLGKARHRSVEWELWALQKGIRPGSDYTLLAREAKKEGLVEEFRVLQQICPRGRVLQARGFDVWSTRYCAIDSRAELLSLARRMLRLPPRGTIALVPEPQ
jgi:hypothetical protein